MTIPKFVQQLGLVLVPELDDTEIRTILQLIRKKFRYLSNYEHRKANDVHFVSNGPMVDSEDEMFVKVVDSAEIKIASGRNLGMEKLLEISDFLLNNGTEGILDGRINAFDYRCFWKTPYEGNHYEILRKSLMSSGPLDGFYKALLNSGNDIHIRDNDVSIFSSLGGNKVLLFKIFGRTTRKEIFLNDFDEKDITLSFGILQEKATEILDDLSVVVRDHAIHTEKLFQSTTIAIRDSIEENISKAEKQKSNQSEKK